MSTLARPGRDPSPPGRLVSAWRGLGGGHGAASYSLVLGGQGVSLWHCAEWLARSGWNPAAAAVIAVMAEVLTLVNVSRLVGLGVTATRSERIVNMGGVAMSIVFAAAGNLAEAPAGRIGQSTALVPVAFAIAGLLGAELGRIRSRRGQELAAAYAELRLARVRAATRRLNDGEVAS